MSAHLDAFCLCGKGSVYPGEDLFTLGNRMTHAVISVVNKCQLYHRKSQLHVFSALQDLIAVRYIPHPVVAARDRISVEEPDYSSEIDDAADREYDQHHKCCQDHKYANSNYFSCKRCFLCVKGKIRLADKLFGSSVDIDRYPDRDLNAVSFLKIMGLIFYRKIKSLREIKTDLVRFNIGFDQSVLGITIDLPLFLAIRHIDIPAFFTAGILAFYIDDLA